MGDAPSRPPRRGGRPRLDPTGHPAKVCLTLPAKTYDQLYEVASRELITVPALIRHLLTRRRPEPPPR